MTIHTRRMTSATDGEFVVFLIGMRVNRWWKPWQWLRTAMAMPRMLRELTRPPGARLSGWRVLLGPHHR